MAASNLQLRLETLRRAQNPDGGWGYYPGKQSWLEPTFYAALAFHGDPVADRAWNLLKTWQSPDGSWRPSGAVDVSSWGTALCVTMAQIRGEFADPFRKGVDHLLATSGAESYLSNRFKVRLAKWLGMGEATDHDASLKGWPWKTENSAWVEPTALTLVALKKAAAKVSDSTLRDRVLMGEKEILDVRCKDGGWNYGNNSVLQQDLNSYPETTAVALVGIQGHAGLEKSLALASRQLIAHGTEPLARAWLTIALRLHGINPPDLVPAQESSDLMIHALSALAEPEGNHQLLKATAL